MDTDTERVEFKGEFSKVDFKTQKDSNDMVALVVEFTRSGTKEEMKEFESAIQPVINEGMSGFSLVGEEKQRNSPRGGTELYRDRISVDNRFSLEKCTWELTEGGFTSMKIRFGRFWPIKELDQMPQKLLKFRGQTCDIVLDYFVKQGMLPFGDSGTGKTSVTIYTPDGDGVTADLDEVAEVLRQEQARRAADNLNKMAEDDGAKWSVAPDRDQLFDQAVSLFVKNRTASTTSIQREFSIGYGRAAKIMAAMEAAGLIGTASGENKGREVLPAAAAYIESLGAE